MRPFFTEWHTKLLKLFLIAALLDFGITQIGVHLYGGEEANPVFAPIQHDFISFFLLSAIYNSLLIAYIIGGSFLNTFFTKKFDKLSYLFITLMFYSGITAHLLGFASWIPLIFGFFP